MTKKEVSRFIELGLKGKLTRKENSQYDKLWIKFESFKCPKTKRSV